jgi:hypothetical protein
VNCANQQPIGVQVEPADQGSWVIEAMKMAFGQVMKAMRFEDLAWWLASRV